MQSGDLGGLGWLYARADFEKKNWFGGSGGSLDPAGLFGTRRTVRNVAGAIDSRKYVVFRVGYRLINSHRLGGGSGMIHIISMDPGCDHEWIRIHT